MPTTQMNPQTPNNEVARLREELDRFKLGFQGSCYACEPVGEMNHKLEAEIARLRELLNRAIEIADEFWRNQKQAVTVWHGELADELEKIKSNARLAPAPEEPTIKESLTVQPDWRELGPDEVIQEGDEVKSYRGDWQEAIYTVGRKIEKHEIGQYRTRRPLPDPVPTQTPTQNEWRELGPDEVIQEGDQVQAKHQDKVHGVWFEVFPYEHGAMPIEHEAFRYRTRRPLPVQEEMPLEGDIEDLEEIANSESLPSSVAAIAAKTTYAIRYLRDEIQKLKQK